MGSINHVEVLRGRSHLFLDYAKEALRREHFDLAVFCTEQALQLRLKSVALRLLGYIPRIHGVRELLGLISKALEGIERSKPARLISEFAETHREELRSLEEAYVASRYLPKTYEYEDATRALNIVNEAFKLLDKVEDDVFSA